MKKLLLSALLLLTVSAFAQKQYTLQSPDGKITVTVSEDEHVVVGLMNSPNPDKRSYEFQEYRLCYSVKHEETVVLDKSEIAMHIDNGRMLGVSSKPSITTAKTKSVNQTVKAPFYKRAEIRDQYNELVLNFKGNYKVVFRAYNEGVAYRFQTDFKKPFEVRRETAQFNFDDDYQALVPYVLRRAGQEGDLINQQFYNSFENTYTHTALSQMDTQKLAFLPLLVELKDGKKAVITEADLEDYPGLYLRKQNVGNGLFAVHAGYPKTREQSGHNNLQWIVKERENYIAKVEGKRSFPWRCIVISESDKELADSDLVYLLAAPSRVEDVSWIQPGKVAWDWWNAWNIYGVDFEAGINNDTYKYYIDFASKHGIEYIILDEGWAVNKKADLFQVIPEIDLREIINYGKSKNVGIILWAGYWAFARDMEHVCKHFAEMGVKGFKVDFMDRDDQAMTKFFYDAAEIASRYHLMLDFHGAFKPSGLTRTYPNVINFEGVYGLENAKWGSRDRDHVIYDAQIPFIRQAAGPMDYTQGAMKNAVLRNFYGSNSEPMSMGTRCHQLALYIVLDSPINMLCDSPTNYMKEPDCTEFIAQIPTVWDQSCVMEGEIGKFIVTARQKGNTWYIGGITDWTARDINVDTSILPAGNYQMEIFQDGVNADRKGTDFKKIVKEFKAGSPLQIHLAPGGGFAIKFIKK